MPAPKAFARFVRLTPLESLADLRAGLEHAHRRAAEVGRTVPLDVMFGPMGVGRYGDPRFDAPAYIEQAGQLRELGVTYAGVSFSMPEAVRCSPACAFSSLQLASCTKWRRSSEGSDAGSDQPNEPRCAKIVPLQ